jgi:hypothetical protein
VGDSDKIDIDVFDQIDEVLEERAGSDRRKADLGVSETGADRREGDRRDGVVQKNK